MQSAAESCSYLELKYERGQLGLMLAPLDRKHDRRVADDVVLRVAIRLPAQPTVPALAAILLTRG